MKKMQNTKIFVDNRAIVLVVIAIAASTLFAAIPVSIYAVHSRMLT